MQDIKKALENLNVAVTPSEPEYRDFRAGDVRHSQADVTKAKTLLGYEPDFVIKEGIAEAMPWYKKFLEQTK